MGVRNLRAICPNCGGKIHTQPKGLGHFTWANSWMLVQTGSECQHCGAALSGKVAAGNKAILAEDADKTWRERETGKPAKAASVPRFRLPAEYQRSLVVEFTFEDDADAIFAALHRATLGLGHRLIESDKTSRRLVFKTPFSMASGRLRIEGRVFVGEDDEPGCFLRIYRPAVPLLAWGEKNAVTEQLMGLMLEPM
jgi:hypothetical protein